MFADQLEKHALYHEVDRMELMTAEMREDIDFVMRKDRTLEPSTVYKAVLVDYTNKLEGEEKNELIAVLETTKNDSH